ncbi:MAG: Ferredoxin--NADP reductase [Hyphomicrobiaceae bacterium hypho_1]
MLESRFFAITKVSNRAPNSMVGYYRETVLHVKHWTDTLFSFVTTRNPGFRYENGQFAMVGIEISGTLVARAYSMVSSNYNDYLEWLSIKVSDGPLTSKLQYIKPDDTILISKKPVGTLIIDNLCPGKRLYLLSSGTGLAPFISIICDPVTYERFERVILVHSCRYVDELAYYNRIKNELPNHEFLGDHVREKLIYYPTVTREKFGNSGRITDLIISGKLFKNIAMPFLNAATDRVMICGNPNLVIDMKNILKTSGFNEGSSNKPAEYVVEKAFVEKS